MTMENIPNLMTAVMHSRSLAIQPGPGALKDISDTAKICWLQAYSRTFSPVSAGIQKTLVLKKHALSKPSKSKLAKSLVQRSITLGTLTPKFTVLEINAAKTQNRRLEPQENYRASLSTALCRRERSGGRRVNQAYQL